MTNSPLWQNFFRREKNTVVDYLKGTPIFNNLKTKELQILERYITIRKYMTNEPVFGENEPGTGMYIIMKGSVDIKRGQHDELLVSLSSEDFFGEMALLDESPRSAAAIAAENNVEVVAFFRQDLVKIVDDYPRIACKILWNVGTVLSSRLRENNKALKAISDKK
jgi:CRP/FNR family transcriptional regulator, cyclic AMP receptor protein